MNLFTLFWWLLMCSVAVSLGLTIYALSRRSVTGALPFALITSGWFLWTFGYLLEIQTPTLDGRIFWDNIQFFGIDLAVAGGLLFALAYTGRITQLLTPALQLSLFPLLNLLIVWSDPQHGLLRNAPALHIVNNAVSLVYGYGPWFWTFIVCTYLLISITLFMLVRFAIRNRLHRSSVLAFVVGLSIPTLGGLITVAGLVPIVGAERLDISPLTFAVSGPIIAWGLFRKTGLFDLVPVARSLLIDQMLDGTLVVDARGRIIDANPQAHALLRYAPGSLPGHTLRDLPAAIAGLAATTQRQHGEIRLAGHPAVILEVTVTPLQLSLAGQSGWLIVLRDNTERAGWIDALRERERFIDQINQTTPDMIYVYDLVQRQVVYLNQASVANTGYTPEELSAAGASAVPSLTHPADLPRIAAHRQQLFSAADREILTIEYRVLDAHGNTRWMLGRDTIFSRDAEGQPVLMLGIAQDITARKEAEMAREASEARQRALLASLPDLMFLLNRNGVFLDYQAPRSEELLISPKRFLGAQLEEVLPPELALRTRQVMENLFESGERQIFDYTLLHNGAEQIYEARLTAVDAESVLVLARDVTETRRNTAALQEAKERAEAADQAKSMFVAQMSHEIRTPLNAVIGMVDLLLETPLNAEQREYATMINTGGQSLLGIVNDILDLARIESGRMDLNIQSFMLSECLEESLDLVRHSAITKGLQLHSAYDIDLPSNILGDAPRLRQILVNLLANAIKFTEAGTVTLSATCIQQSTEEATVTISVSDTGIGIAPEKIEAIFTPFTQADGSISRSYGGTGLGLTISRQLALLMHGTLTAVSRPGHGSTFTLSVPFRLPVAVPAQALPAKQVRACRTAPVRLLIVEDNPVNQTVLQRMLLRLGHTCDIVANGWDALEALRKTPYDIVLMDVQMPELDGVATTQLIRGMGEQIVQPAIIAVTASALAGDREEYLAAGMNAYLSKPINLDTLQQALYSVEDMKP